MSSVVLECPEGRCTAISLPDHNKWKVNTPWREFEFDGSKKQVTAKIKRIIRKNSKPAQEEEV